MQLRTLALPLCLGLICGAAAAWAAEALPGGADCGRSLKVAGRGQVRIMPDTVLMRLAAEETAADAAAARQSVERRVAAFMASIGRQKLDAPAVSTISADNITIAPVYRRSEQSPPVLSAHKARRVITVTLYDIALIPAFTTLAMDSGISEVYGFDYRLKDRGAVEQQALQLAVGDAASKAQVIAAAAGITLGAPCRITNTLMDMDDGVTFRARPASLQSRQGDGGEAVYQPGEISVEARVEISYAIGG